MSRKEKKSVSTDNGKPLSTYIDKRSIIKMPLVKICNDGPCEYRCTVPSPDTPNEAFCFNGHKPSKDGTCKHYADEEKWREENLPSLKKVKKKKKRSN